MGAVDMPFEKVGGALGDYVHSAWRRTKWFFHRNMASFGNMLIFAAPFVTAALAAYMTWQRGYLAFGGEYVLGLIMLVIGSTLRYLGEDEGQGVGIPVPSHRFTQRDRNGDVSINEGDLNEVILYMADLEDNLEANGRVNWR